MLVNKKFRNAQATIYTTFNTNNTALTLNIYYKTYNTINTYNTSKWKMIYDFFFLLAAKLYSVRTGIKEYITIHSIL